MTTKVLLSDISKGSHISLALADAGKRPETVVRYACTSYENFCDSLLEFLHDNGDPYLAGAAFSTSGWEVDGHVDLVHYGFTLSRDVLRALLDVQGISLVNNFVAKALSIPSLKEHEYVKVCGGAAIPEQVIAILGPAQGFGGALLAPDGMGRWTASHCEGGHADFAPCNSLEIEILKLMMAKYGHVSRERAVSIPGLVELWQCLSALENDSGPAPAVEEILTLAYADEARAQKALQVQTELFAGTASDYALIMGARGGIYLSGDLLDLMGDLFDHEIFARRFYDKGRVSSYVRDIPVFQVIVPDIEIIGLSTLFA
jgi:glucokinase